jgi:hypothetical protein
MMCLRGALDLTVLGLSISTIRAKSGAAFYIAGVVPVINNSRFINLTAANRSGGANFFGSDSGFAFTGVILFPFRFFFCFCDDAIL